jgi:hypothetical protein
MSEQNGTAAQSVESVQAPVDSKGKGKATAAEPESHDVSMDGDDSSSEEELDEVCFTSTTSVCQS